VGPRTDQKKVYGLENTVSDCEEDVAWGKEKNPKPVEERGKSALGQRIDAKAEGVEGDQNYFWAVQRIRPKALEAKGGGRLRMPCGGEG